MGSSRGPCSLFKHGKLSEKTFSSSPFIHSDHSRFCSLFLLYPCYSWLRYQIIMNTKNVSNENLKGRIKLIWRSIKKAHLSCNTKKKKNNNSNSWISKRIPDTIWLFSYICIGIRDTCSLKYQLYMVPYAIRFFLYPVIFIQWRKFLW